MPICNLHVGSHKTGTSAIQVFLSSNREALKLNGILAPAAGTSPNGSHLPLVHRALGMPVAQHQENALVALKAEISAYPKHDMVISAEFLETVLKRHPVEHPIIGLFGEAGYDVRVILYVRNIAQFLNAQYVQRTKMFRSNKDFSTLLTETLSNNGDGLSRWLQFARRNNCTFVARPYTGHIQAGNLIGDFVQQLGLDWKDTFRQFVLPERQNESVGPTTVATARRIMSLLPGGVQHLTKNRSGRYGRILLEEAKKQGLASEPKFCGMDTTGSRRLTQHFRDQNNRFAMAFWGQSWEEVFSADIEQEFAINDFAQTTMTTRDKEQVERLFEAAWPRIKRVIARAS